MRFSLHISLVASLTLAVLSGCSGGTDGPELAGVGGYVHLDGQPLPGASVIFTPENGSPSYGTTDENGYYTLSYSINQDGAMIGKHKVQISTHRSEDEDAEGNTISAAPETLPAKHNRETTLTAEVKSGSNTIDFKDLKAEGEVVQPSEEEDE